MSEVIRDAIIRLKIELQKAKLESPELTRVSRAYSEQAKAAKDAQRAIDETQRATTESARAVKDYGKAVKDHIGGSLIHFREGGEGALKMARGIAFLSSYGGAGLQEIARKALLAQGAMDVFAGGMKLATNAAAFGPLGIAVAGVTTAVTAGAIAWQVWKSRAEEAKKAAADARLEMDKLAASVRATMSSTSAQERDKASMQGKNAITGNQSEEARRRAREELQIQIKANQGYYNKDAPSFARDNFQQGMSGLIWKPEAFKTQAKAALDYEKERKNLFGLQLDQEREMYQQQRNRLQLATELNRSSFGAATMMAGPIGGLPFAALGQQSADQNKAAMDSMVKVQTDGLEAITRAYDTAVKHIRELENELRFAATK